MSDTTLEFTSVLLLFSFMLAVWLRIEVFYRKEKKTSKEKKCTDDKFWKEWKRRKSIEWGIDEP